MKFSRQSRLLKPEEFKKVFQLATRSGDDSFRVFARTNELNRHRLGMAVSKKDFAKAVDRNRIKRVIRENFRLKIAETTEDKTLDIVVIPTALAKNQSKRQLDESLSAHWQRLIGKAENRITGNQQDRIRTQR